MPFKAPLAHEPVIPVNTTLVVPVVVKFLTLQLLSAGTIFSLFCSPGARHTTCLVGGIWNGIPAISIEVVTSHLSSAAAVPARPVRQAQSTIMRRIIIVNPRKMPGAICRAPIR